MRRLLSDLLLVVTPFGVLSAFFFLGEQTTPGFVFAGVTLAALWSIRPRRAQETPAEEDADPPVAGVGNPGGPV